MLFGILEHLVEAWFHRQSIAGAAHEIRALGATEIGARLLMLLVTLVPFFAFTELGRVLGPARIVALLFGESKHALKHDADAP